MILWKDKKFIIQRQYNCINYNWDENTNKHCAILYSEDINKPKNAYIKYKNCCLENGEECNHYNCGVQLC